MLPLTIAIADAPHTAAVKNGTVPIEGVAAEFVRVVPQIAAFRRMVRNLEFDVCELAPTTYLIARAHGVPIVALPIFLMRRFHHGGLLVRPEAGIREPKDLEGRRVGVRAWSVTTGVWTRGIFASEYGLDCSKVTWVVDDEEHVRELKLPDNVIHAPEGRSLAAMMAAGELDAGFEANAGIGRSGSPTGGGWQQADTAHYPDLFPDAAAREAEWYRRTAIYPMHGTLVVKEELLAREPWLARALFDAFARAKEDWRRDLDSGKADTANDRKYRALSRIVGSDPLPYGIAANRASLEALADIAFAQQLTPMRVPVEEAFVALDQ
jgi:4,5-dihydroxyphthalate decarboxylase